MLIETYLYLSAGDTKVNQEVHCPSGALMLSAKAGLTTFSLDPVATREKGELTFDHFKIKMNSSNRGV